VLLCFGSDLCILVSQSLFLSLPREINENRIGEGLSRERERIEDSVDIGQINQEDNDDCDENPHYFDYYIPPRTSMNFN
jgi:hypothetical protein